MGTGVFRDTCAGRPPGIFSTENQSPAAVHSASGGIQEASVMQNVTGGLPARVNLNTPLYINNDHPSNTEKAPQIPKQP